MPVVTSVLNLSAVPVASSAPTTSSVPLIPTAPSVPAVTVTAAPAAPILVVKQLQPTKPYTGQTSWKSYKEYFTRLALCNSWTTRIEKAQNLFIAMEGTAAKTVRGLTADKDEDNEAIWDYLARHFGHIDEPEHA